MAGDGHTSRGVEEADETNRTGLLSKRLRVLGDPLGVISRGRHAHAKFKSAGAGFAIGTVRWGSGPLGIIMADIQ